MSDLLNYLKTVADWRRQTRCGTVTFKHECFEDFVLQEGHAYTSQALTNEEWRVFLDASKGALRSIRSKDFPIKQCFTNSQRLVLNDYTKTLNYVEGYATSIIPLHHGWVEINGKVIDVTLRMHRETPYDRKKFPDRAIGEIPGCREYYGVKFSHKEVLEYMVKTESLGSLINDWERGFPYLKNGR